MYSTTAVVYLLLVQLESWTGHVEFLEEHAELEKGDHFEVVLWSLKSYSNVCDLDVAVPVSSRIVTPPNDDVPVRFKRLRQGLYCFTARTRGNATPPTLSSVVSLSGQAPVDRCCQGRGASVLWRTTEDGVLSASVVVSDPSPSCAAFVVRVRSASGSGACNNDSDTAASSPVVEYYVVKNSVVHVRNLNRSRRYCLSASAGCRVCGESCPVMDKKVVAFGKLKNQREVDLLPPESVVAPISVEDARATLDPVIAFLGFVSIVFIVIWAAVLYRRLQNAVPLPYNQRNSARKRNNFV